MACKINGFKAELLKWWVMCRKWVPEPSCVGCENAICKKTLLQSSQCYSYDK